VKKIVLVSVISIFVVALIILNLNVTTRQGVNYEWQTIKIPLYLKVLGFIDRHYNYKTLVKKITEDAKSETEVALKLFEWTHRNIRKVPKDFPVIDDHVWNIIIRGYGANDQSSHVFTTLCNYAGLKAFYSWAYTKEKTKRIPLSYVGLGGKWVVFDPYSGIYFKNKNSAIASINELKDGDWVVISTLGAEKPAYDYKEFFVNLPDLKDITLNRSSIQSPLKRLIFEVKRWIKTKQR